MVPSTELNTDAAEMLLASNESGEGTPVHASFTATRPYVLGYTGDTINELLDLVYNNNEALSSLDTYVDDKINAKLEEDITQALDDEY